MLARADKDSPYLVCIESLYHCRLLPSQSENKEIEMKTQACVPIDTTDGRILCYSCYQDDDTAELEMWMPDDPDNYPEECDNCGLLMTWPGARKSPSKDLPGQTYLFRDV